MKVSLFNSLYPPLGIGGSEVSTYFLAKGLVDLGCDVQVISENVENELVRYNDEGVDVVRLPNPDGFGPNILDEPMSARIQRRKSVKMKPFTDRLKSGVDKFSTDIVHTSVIGRLREIWRMGSLMDVPVVHTLRSYSMICSQRMLDNSEPCVRQCGKCAAPVGRIEARDESSNIDAIVGISNHILKVHREAGWFANVEHSRVISNSFAIDKGETLEDRHDWNRLYDFGYIGRLHPTKGVDQFLCALEELEKRTGNRYSVLIAGTGNKNYESFLRKRFANLNVKFAGFVKPSVFYKQIKKCVVPSLWYEPFGRIFIESMAYGVPVLASNRGGGSELITEKCGFVFNPGDIENFVETLNRASELTSVEQNQLSENAIAQSTQYSVVSIATKYLNLYEKMISNRT